MAAHNLIRARLGRNLAALMSGLALAATATASFANATYTVNQVIGAGSVTGQITTDGTTGVLTQANIIGWNLTLTGVGATTTLTSAGGQSLVNVVGGDLAATGSILTFNYSGVDTGYFFFQAASPGLFSGAKYYCNNTNWFGCAAGASVVPQTYADASAQFDATYTGLRTIASLGGPPAPPAPGGPVPLGALASLTGAPESLQFGLIDQALNPEGLGQLDFDQPANLIGVQYGRSYLAGQSANRVDVSYQRGFRVFPGSRSLLIVRLPLSYFDAPAGAERRAVGSVSLEYPVTPQWTLQPTLSYGAFKSNTGAVSGQMAATTVASLYTLNHPLLGRGQLTLGNMVGVTRAMRVKLNGLPATAPPNSFVTRDGFAYEYPLNRQFDGRMASVRASYTYTYSHASGLPVVDSHDVALSVGVRTRGAEARNSFELFRLGVRAQQSDNAHAAYIFGGFRF